MKLNLLLLVMKNSLYRSDSAKVTTVASGAESFADLSVCALATGVPGGWLNHPDGIQQEPAAENIKMQAFIPLERQ